MCNGVYALGLSMGCTFRLYIYFNIFPPFQAIMSTIKLKSSEREVFVVDVEVAKQSGTIKAAVG